MTEQDDVVSVAIGGLMTCGCCLLPCVLGFVALILGLLKLIVWLIKV